MRSRWGLLFATALLLSFYMPVQIAPAQEGQPADFGAGPPPSQIDPAHGNGTVSKAIADTQAELRGLDDAEANVTQEHDDLADALKAVQLALDTSENSSARMIALGEMSREQSINDIRLVGAIVREIKQRLAETDRTLEAIKDKRAGLSQELEILELRQQQQSRETPQQTAAAGSRSSTVESGQDRMGSDYTHFPLDSDDPAICKKSCLDDGRCKAWTYVNRGVQGDKPMCWLKSSVPDPHSSSCCTSGKIETGQ